MLSHFKVRSPLHAVLLAAMVVSPIAFLGSIPWLKHQPDGMVFLFAGIASTLTVLSSVALAVIADRRMDEWHRSASRFSSQWGWMTGSALVALLMALPPVHDLIVVLPARLTHTPNPDRELVIIAFTFGFITVVAAQGLCTMLLGLGWNFWMSRSAREPS